MPDSILIADDYDDNRELLRLMLESEGYHIREARDGREALDAAREDVPAAALIDLSMPSLDGWGLLRELRAGERRARSRRDPRRLRETLRRRTRRPQLLSLRRSLRRVAGRRDPRRAEPEEVERVGPARASRTPRRVGHARRRVPPARR